MKHRICLLMFMVIVLSGCAAVVTSPEVRLQQINPVRIDSAGMDIEVDLFVNNPNRFDLTLLGYSYNLQVAGRPFSSGETRQTTIFPANQEILVRIPARVRHINLLELLQLQLDLNHLPYHLIAELQLATPLGESSIPLDQQGQLKIPEKYRPNVLMQSLKDLFSPL